MNTGITQKGEIVMHIKKLITNTSWTFFIGGAVIVAIATVVLSHLFCPSIWWSEAVAFVLIWTTVHMAKSSSAQKFNSEQKGHTFLLARGRRAVIEEHCLPMIAMLPVAATYAYAYVYVPGNTHIIEIAATMFFMFFWGSIHNGLRGPVRLIPAATVSLLLLAISLIGG